MRAPLVGARRRVLVWPALVIAAAVGIAVWRLQGGGPAHPSLPVVAAARGDVIVSVGGVGRIVEARAATPIAVPVSAGGVTPAAGGSGPTAGGTAPADAVFPRASGHVLRFLVAPGEHVAAGQPLAVLDDGGLAAAAVRQARNDFASALLELRQKQTSDPLNGLPPTFAELAPAQQAVISARAQLARLLGRPLRADVSALRLDVKRAKVEQETLLGGPPAGRAEAISLAQHKVQLAQEQLDRTLAPPSPADVSAAQLEVDKALADLARLKEPAPSASAEQIAAAEQALTAAQLKLTQLEGSPSPDPVDVSVAEAEVKKAEAELAALRKPAPGPLSQEVTAADQAVSVARLKLAKLLEPPSPADVTAARLELERAQAELRTLEAGPSSAARGAARQAVDSAQAQLTQLLGPPLRADFAAGRLNVRRAEADLAVLRARGGPASPTDIGLAWLKVKAARARLALARFAERQLTVRASSGGTVTALLTGLGAPVDASTPIATVADLRHLAVTVDLSEFDAARVGRGLPAVVSVDALGGKSFPGEVLFVGLTGVDSGGVVTFPVRLALAHVTGVRPGMNVSVRIVVAQRRDVVRVPLEAVASGEKGRPIVTVVDASGRTSPRRVTLGLANNKDVEIVSGLGAGERVVLAGSQGG